MEDAEAVARERRGTKSKTTKVSKGAPVKRTSAEGNSRLIRRAREKGTAKVNRVKKDVVKRVSEFQVSEFAAM